MKTKYTQIRLTEEEKQKLKKQAAEKGLDVSSYIRMLVYEAFNTKN